MFYQTIALLVLALGVAARDDRIVVTHPDNVDFCYGWNDACTAFSPATSVILNSLCEAGDMGGNNPSNTSTVLCAVGTGQLTPVQLTLITQFVANKLGAAPQTGLPQDAC